MNVTVSLGISEALPVLVQRRSFNVLSVKFFYRRFCTMKLFSQVTQTIWMIKHQVENFIWYNTREKIPTDNRTSKLQCSIKGLVVCGHLHSEFYTLYLTWWAREELNSCSKGWLLRLNDNNKPIMLQSLNLICQQSFIPVKQKLLYNWIIYCFGRSLVWILSLKLLTTYLLTIELK